MAHLLFMIDSTHSMKLWIHALNELLPSVLKSMALTNVFERIGIINYYDYNGRATICNFSGFVDSLNHEQVDKIRTFARSMYTDDGYDIPEAVKTCLFEISQIVKDIRGKVYIIHLTDAPPHAVSDITIPTEREKKFLKDNFDWIKIVNLLLESNNRIRYMCLTSCIHSFYCYLAQKTGGDVFYLSCGVSSNNIRKEIAKVFDGFLGTNVEATCGHRMTIANMNHLTEKTLSRESCINTNNPSTPCPELVGSLTKSAHRIKTDEAFATYISEEFRSLIDTDVMAFTISPILGKMWREFCKRRRDPKRDELIKLLQSAKNKLDFVSKGIMETWLKESYDATSEINDDIREFIEKNRIEGLLRFLPENEDLCAQQVVQLLASGDKKSTAIIRAILSRLYIDKSYSHEIVDKSEEFVLPKKSIPLNLELSSFFELIMHTVAPGTKFTRRYSALLACHSIQCGCVLKELAEKYLTIVRGKWINWTRREDQTPEVPENWSKNFLDLILHKDCQHFLTPGELTYAQNLREISTLMIFYHNVEVNVKIIDVKSVDTTYPDYMIICKQCNNDRPLSLIAEDGICGYCKHDDTDPTKKYIQVRCYSCGSIYSREADVNIPGHSKCHACRFTDRSASTFECSVCNLNFVNWTNSSYKICKGCADGLKPRILQHNEYPELIHRIFGDHFKTLCQNVGFLVDDKFVPNSGLYDAELHITKSDVTITEIPNNVTFRDSPIQNIEELWNYVLEILKGRTIILPECALCLETKPASDLIRACGRKGCEQRICVTCSESWYGKNKEGDIIFPRTMMCQFCARMPDLRILGRISRNLAELAYSLKHTELDQDKYYAWCKQCLKHYEVGDRACAVAVPNIVDFKCHGCSVPKTKEISVLTKECPSCSVETEKQGGCNHINCPNCNTHWCWECGEDCKTSGDTYDHMNSVHGRIFEDEQRHDHDHDDYDYDYDDN